MFLKYIVFRRVHVPVCTHAHAHTHTYTHTHTHTHTHTGRRGRCWGRGGRRGGHETIVSLIIDKTL